MRKWFFRLVILVVLVAAVIGLKLTVFAPDPVPVQIAVVETGKVEDTVTNSKAGTVKTRQKARLSPETGGRVVALPYREGMQVKAGDVLLRVDDSTLKAQLALNERSLEEAEAVREQSCLLAERATRELDRYRKLAENRIVSPDILDHYQSNYETADAACRAARARVQSARATLA